MRIKTIIGIFVLIVFAIINVDLAFSQDDELLEKMPADEDLQQELKWLKAETYVITASKVMETIKKAPASITVITDRQIRQMGAKALWDVLMRAVPGVALMTTFEGIRNFLVRGGGHFLLMINSHPIHDGRAGSALPMYDDLIIDNIKRVEVIRGPGSALYGANAFAGVINVITKEAEDIDGFELTARGGSWDTQQYNLLFGKSFNDLELDFNLNFFKTHGFRGFIEEDFQTSIDRQTSPYFPPASLAPGRMKGDREKYDLVLSMKYKGFKLDGKYVDKEWEPPLNLVAVLNNKTIYSHKDYYFTLSYEAGIWEGLDLYGKVYRNFNDQDWDLQQYFPPGFTAMTPTGPATWGEGWKFRHIDKSLRTGIEIQATYNISESNTIVAGATYEYQKIYGSSKSGNFLPVNGIFFKFPSVQKWPDEFNEDTEKRNFKAVFFEDIWDLTEDLRLTMGARYDDYSDFGDHFSPRVGLTWEYIKGYDLKLLYGHAFRAPTFFELSYAASGKPDLDPETIDMYEVSLGAELTSSLNGRVTLYHRERKDMILTFDPPGNYVNLGGTRDQGIELEMKYDFGRGTYFAGHYIYMSPEDYDSRYYGTVMGNIRLSRYLNFYVDYIFFDGGSRWLPDDTRNDWHSGGIVNATLIAKKFLKGYENFELRGSVYNLLDKDAKSPQTPALPNDLPMSGINYLLEIKYKF